MPTCCSYFTGTGRAGDTAPGERHLYRVPVSSSAGAEPTCLTCPDTGEETGDTCTNDSNAPGAEPESSRACLYSKVLIAPSHQAYIQVILLDVKIEVS